MRLAASIAASLYWVNRLDDQGFFDSRVLSQAAVAWVLREEPHIGVAVGLTVYQPSSAMADWVMWIVLSDDGVFATTSAQVLVVAAIASHYALGLLLVRAIAMRSRRTPLVP